MPVKECRETCAVSKCVPPECEVNLSIPEFQIKAINGNQLSFFFSLLKARIFDVILSLASRKYPRCIRYDRIDRSTRNVSSFVAFQHLPTPSLSLSLFAPFQQRFPPGFLFRFGPERTAAASCV